MILGTSRLEESISVALRVGTPQNCHPLSTFPDDATAAAAAAAAVNDRYRNYDCWSARSFLVAANIHEYV